MDFWLKANLRKILLANVIAQVGIVVTGGLVRVTSSGLGCPTWPECVDGSITPTSAQTESWHKYVEFGNRLLTFVLVIIAAMVIVAIRKSKLGRRDLTILSYSTLAGILIQVVLGGITVLTKLHPLTVAAHFLVSIGLISIAFALHRRAVETENVTKPKPSFELTVPPIFRQGAQLHTALALLVIVVGTIVTGSGPHAGDVNEVTRLPIDPRVISWLHADLVLLYIGLTLGLYVAAKSLKLNSVIVRAIVTVLVVSAVQGVIGYVQYFTGLPWVLVAFHITGSCLLWIATLNLLFTTRKLT